MHALDPIPTPVIYGVIGALGVLLVLVYMARNLLAICRPNEILIFSGRKHTTPDGREIGFRVVHGGRGWRVPVLESVTRMDVSNITVTMQVAGAYTSGGIPLTVSAVANVKIATDERYRANAIERFLTSQRADIARVAKETLEGHLRGVLATMTPEELNEDRLKFAKHLEDQAGPDMVKLGLQIDTLKMMHVSDERQYLESLGRKRIAEILRTAEVAESDAVREAENAEAASRARAQVATTNATTEVQKKANELRQIKAQLDGQARAAEETTQQAGLQARAEAELELQQIRGELEGLRLEADVTIPAEIEKQVRELLAAGQAAPIAADGEAMAGALAAVTEAWKESGGKAMDMFVLQNLDAIFGEVARAARKVKVGQVNLLDGGDGHTVAAYASAYPQTVGALFKEIASTLGIDVARVLNGGNS